MSLRDLIFDGCGVITLNFPFDGGAVAAPAALERGARLFDSEAESPVVAALLTNDRASVELAFGAIEAQVRLVSLPLPGRGSDVLVYAAWLREALAAVGADHVVARPDLARLMASVGLPAVAHDTLSGGPPLARPGDHFRLVQFTSGSTGPPLPIELDGHALEVNLRAILNRVAPRSGDVTVSWLPLSHDMGLVGMLLASMAASGSDWTSGGDVVLLPPEQFLRDPSLWVRALAEWKATFTAAPDFGYRLATRSPPPAVDLSAVRNAIVGGEIVRPSTLVRVEECLAPIGLSPTALAPAYGLAEVGLAVAITGPTERWRPVTAEPGFPVAASGRPLDGYGVEVAPETGALTIRVPAAGRDGISGRPLAASDGRLSTGDVGFLTNDGWLCVTGRADDTIVANGRNLYAPALEEALSRIPGVREGRATAVGIESGGWIVAVELDRHGAEDGSGPVARAVRVCCSRTVGVGPDEVVLLEPGALPMTSSGKLRRNEVRRRWEDDTLG